MRTFFGLCLLSLISVAVLADDNLTYITFQQPCRIIDTRLSTGGILASGVPRSFKVAGTTGFEDQGGTAGGCGVPTEAAAALMNFVAVNPTGAGNIRGASFPNAVPTTGSLLNYQLLSPNLNIANGLPFPICDHSGACAFDITVQPNGASVHLVADVVGWFRQDHKHDGEDITGGTVSEAWIDSAIARDSEIFPTVLANDGSGSTLDADFVDGMDASAFAPVAHSHAGVVYQRTIVVPGGGTPTANGTALLGAMASITTNSSTNQFLLKIEPGIFDLGNNALVMKEFVDVEGSGETATLIRRSTSGACFAGKGTVLGSMNAELRFLTAENTGGGNCSIALEIVGTAPRVTHVTLTASGGIQQNEGADVISGLPVFNDVQIVATGGTIYTAGVWNTGGASTLIGVRITASGATVNLGMMNAAGSGTSRIHRSIIEAATHPVRTGGGEVHIADSQLLGGPVDQGPSTTIRCYGVYDEDFQNSAGLTGCP